LIKSPYYQEQKITETNLQMKLKKGKTQDLVNLTISKPRHCCLRITNDNDKRYQAQNFIITKKD